MSKKYPYPVYATQGGGLARKEGDTFVFVEAPEPIMDLKAGDEVPAQWGIAPANEHAHNEEYSLELKEADPEIVALFRSILDGKASWDEVKDKIPPHQHDEIKNALGIR